MTTKLCCDWLVLRVKCFIIRSVTYRDKLEFLGLFKVPSVRIFNWMSIVTQSGDLPTILETVQDFLIKLGIKPLMHLLEISIFSLNNDLVRLTKIMNNLVKDLKILSFKVIFQCLKLVESLQKKILLIFEILYFLKLCPIFVGSVHNFGNSENDFI